MNQELFDNIYPAMNNAIYPIALSSNNTRDDQETFLFCLAYILGQCFFLSQHSVPNQIDIRMIGSAIESGANSAKDKFEPS